MIRFGFLQVRVSGRAGSKKLEASTTFCVYTTTTRCVYTNPSVRFGLVRFGSGRVGSGRDGICWVRLGWFRLGWVRLGRVGLVGWLVELFGSFWVGSIVWSVVHMALTVCIHSKGKELKQNWSHLTRIISFLSRRRHQGAEPSGVASVAPQ